MAEEKVHEKFNTKGRQLARFVKEDDARYELTFAIDGLDKEDLIEFDRLTVSTQKIDGNTIIFENDDLDASVWFFKKNVQLVDGFEGELPENWHSEFSALEMQEIVRTFLDQRISVDNENKVTKKFNFGGTKPTRTIRLIATYNGKEILLPHTLPNNADSFAHEFKRITRPNEMKRGDEGLSSPSVWEPLGELYDEMKIVADDYEENDVPLHHKALVVRETFGANLQKQAKKLKA